MRSLIAAKHKDPSGVVAAKDGSYPPQTQLFWAYLGRCQSQVGPETPRKSDHTRNVLRMGTDLFYYYRRCFPAYTERFGINIRLVAHLPRRLFLPLLVSGIAADVSQIAWRDLCLRVKWYTLLSALLIIVLVRLNFIHLVN
jgi:hypothetical protein